MTRKGLAEDIPYEDTKALPKELLQAGHTPMQADLFLVTWRDRPAILKAFGDRPLLLRQLWCRRVLAHEAEILVHLRDFGEGLPLLLARAGPDEILLQLLPGECIDLMAEPAPL